MKKVFYIICILVFLISCDDQAKKSSNILATRDTSIVLVDSAKYFIDRANDFVIKGIKKEMKQSKVNDSLKPYMDKYFEIYKRLKPEDTLLLQEYRVKKINELIDLKLQLEK